MRSVKATPTGRPKGTPWALYLACSTCLPELLTIATTSALRLWQ